MRKVLDFNDFWTFNKPGQTPSYVSLPHTWNRLDGQDGGNDYWRGTAIYRKRFPMPEAGETEKVFLEIQGAAMTADVELNGSHLAHHKGGYSTFRVEITPFLKEENIIEIMVDNGTNESVYPQSADFTFYGGLTRDVRLLVVPEIHFELVEDGTPGIRVTPSVDLENQCAAVTVETWQNGGSVSFELDGQSQTVASCEGYAKAEFCIEHVRLWDGLDDPFLYTVTARLSSGDEVHTRFGCRSFKILPDKGFFLNGRSYPLRGVSRHQDWEAIGSALKSEQHLRDMKLLRELGANTVRLAHYQHAQEFYDLCDEYGLIVWAEIPYISKHMADGVQNTMNQMRELIAQNYNHPSIVCWGLSNEISAVTAVTEDVVENHRKLNALCHQLDSTRLTTMAHIFTLKADNPLAGLADISSYNLYFGWYQGKTEETGTFLDAYHTQYPDRVIGLSEYGADANFDYHSSAPTRGDYTEEYQCLYHEKMLELIEKRPYLWATHVWNLFDFASDARDEGGVKGRNLKGLVSFDRKTKKDAFYLYKAAWSKEPFVHICGRRYVERTEEQTKVTVYTNCPSVILLLDGALLEKKSGARMVQFTVPISAEHRLKAIADGCSDEIIIRRVSVSNDSYRYKESGEVGNWFELLDGFFSINDTIGDLMQNAAAKSIVMKLFIGDAAEGEQAELSPDMMQMISGLSLKNVLKRAPKESGLEALLPSINKALQKISK